MAIRRPSIELREPILCGNAFRFNMRQIAEGFDCRIADEGSDYCKFEVTDTSQSIRNMARWFEGWLGSDLRVETGDRRIFRGFLNTVTFEVAGDAEIRTLDDMANEVIVEFDDDRDDDWLTGIVTDPDGANSRRCWGRKMVRLRRPEYTDTADAESAGRRYLRKCQNAPARPLAESEQVRINFEFVGYLQLLDWLEVTVTAGMTVKQAIEAVVTTVGQAVISFEPGATGSIGDNGAVLNGDIEGTGLEVLRALVELDSADGALWKFWLDGNLIARFEPIDMRPYYTKRANRTQRSSDTFYARNGSQRLSPWEARAGVIRRNQSYPITRKEIGSPYLDRRDRYIEAVRFDIEGNHKFETLADYPETGLIGLR